MEELSQHILDIALNSLEAGADMLEITVLENLLLNTLEFTVRDNGRGIAGEDLPKVIDPFYTTKKDKRVGLGIPLLREAVERCGGLFEIKVAPLTGTTVKAVFPHNHIDRAPLGDMAGTIITLITASLALRLTYRHCYNDRDFIFDTGELEPLLGDIPLRTPAALLWLEEYLSGNVALIKEADKNEKLGRTG